MFAYKKMLKPHPDNFPLSLSNIPLFLHFSKKNLNIFFVGGGGRLDSLSPSHKYAVPPLKFKYI